MKNLPRAPALDIPMEEPLAGWPVSAWRALRALDRDTPPRVGDNGHKILVRRRIAVQSLRIIL